MDKFLSILEENQQQDQCIDTEKLKYITSQIAIWDYFSIPRAHYLVLDNAEKSRILSEYYRKLVTEYFGTGKIFFYYFIFLFFFVLVVLKKSILAKILFVEKSLTCFYFAVFVGEQRSGYGNIDYAISHAVKDSTKLSMTKKIHDGDIETSITAEKGSSFDKKSCRFLGERWLLSTATVQF